MQYWRGRERREEMKVQITAEGNACTMSWKVKLN
jgi:hypothetical protein